MRRRVRWVDDPECKAAFDRVMLRFSRDIHQFRTREGLSIDRAAIAAGVHRDTVQAIEQLRTDPRLSTLIRLLHLFGFELSISYRYRWPLRL
jgi:DNA-binding XRE family transcriptional regulator